MSDVLLDLPSHLRDRLVSALESGLLGSSPTPASLRSVLGNREDTEGLAASLLELERLGISGPGAAAWLRLFSGPARELGSLTLCGPAPRSLACTLGIPDESTKSCWALRNIRSGQAHTPFSTDLRRSRF